MITVLNDNIVTEAKEEEMRRHFPQKPTKVWKESKDSDM